MNNGKSDLDKFAPGVVQPHVDFNRCEAKGPCAEVCPYDVFEIRRIDPSDFRQLGLIGKLKNRVHRSRVAYTPNADQCRGCALCVQACPEKAIRLIKASDPG